MCTELGTYHRCMHGCFKINFSLQSPKIIIILWYDNNIIIILQFLAIMEMLGYMDHQLIEQESFMSVSMVHGEKYVEVNVIQSLPLLSVHNLATHLMVCMILY